MKLIFINLSPIWGGGEQWTCQTALSFKKKNYEVEIIVLAGSKLAEKCRKQNLLHYLYLDKWNSSSQKKKFISDTDRSGTPPILLTNSGRDLLLANLIKKQNTRAQIIFRRGLDRRLANNIINRRKYIHIDLMIVNSLSTRRTLVKSFPWFPTDKIHVVYNSIDSRLFLNFQPQDIRQKFQIPPNGKVIGIIGRLARQKGHLYALEMLHQLLSGHPDTYLLIAGTGEEEKALKKKVQLMNLSDNCRFTGHIDEVQPYYQACDVIIIPSLFEGFCFTAIEAQLLERPVVAFDSSSLPEVVQHERSGYLVPAGDVAQMTCRIQQLLENADLRKQMGQQGRKFVETNFSAAKIYDQLENIVQSLVR